MWCFQNNISVESQEEFNTLNPFSPITISRVNKNKWVSRYRKGKLENNTLTCTGSSSFPLEGHIHSLMMFPFLFITMPPAWLNIIDIFWLQRKGRKNSFRVRKISDYLIWLRWWKSLANNLPESWVPVHKDSVMGWEHALYVCGRSWFNLRTAWSLEHYWEWLLSPWAPLGLTKSGERERDIYRDTQWKIRIPEFGEMAKSINQAGFNSWHHVASWLPHTTM